MFWARLRLARLSYGVLGRLGVLNVLWTYGIFNVHDEFVGVEAHHKPRSIWTDPTALASMQLDDVKSKCIEFNVNATIFEYLHYSRL